MAAFRRCSIGIFKYPKEKKYPQKVAQIIRIVMNLIEHFDENAHERDDHGHGHASISKEILYND